MDGAGHEGEQGRVVERVHIMERKGIRESELAYQSSHYFRVVFWMIGVSIVYW